MYVVVCDNIVIHDDRTPHQNEKLIDSVLSLDVHSAGSFKFSLSPNNVGYNIVHRMISTIEIYRDERVIWRGRVYSESLDFFGNKYIVCESALAFLNDSIQIRKMYTDNNKNVLKALIDNHNSVVPSDRRILLGDINILFELNEFITDYDSTYKYIVDDIQNTYGGYLRLRYEESDTYLDYLSTVPNPRSSKGKRIRFGENLLDFVQNIEFEDFATRILPIAKPKKEKESGSQEHSGQGNETAEETEEQRIKREQEARIKEKEELEKERNKTAIDELEELVVSDWVVNYELENKYGRIEKVVRFEEELTREELDAKAQEYIRDKKFDIAEIEVTAIDARYLGIEIDDFELYDIVNAKSEYHDLDVDLRITEMEISLDKPENNTIKLTGKKPSKSSSVSRGVAVASRTSEDISMRNETITEIVERERERISREIDLVKEMAEEEIRLKEIMFLKKYNDLNTTYEDGRRQLMVDVENKTSNISDELTSKINANKALLEDNIQVLSSKITNIDSEISLEVDSLNNDLQRITATQHKILTDTNGILLESSSMKNALTKINLLQNSKFNDPGQTFAPWMYRAENYNDISIRYNNGYYYLRLNTNSGEYNHFSQRISNAVKADTTYTISGWVNCSVDYFNNNNNKVLADVRHNNGTSITILKSVSVSMFVTPEKWKFFNITFKVPNSFSSTIGYIDFNLLVCNPGVLYFRDLFMVEGPDAANGEYVSGVVRYSDLSISPDGIISTVGRTVNGTAYASRISQSADAIALIAKRIQIGGATIEEGKFISMDISANAVKSTHISAGSITGDKLTVDSAMIKALSAKIVRSEEAYIKDIIADSITAIRIRADQIQSGVLDAFTIHNSIIKFGKYGHIVKTFAGININSPKDEASNSGVSMLLCGKPGGVNDGYRDYPEGVFIYRNPDFSTINQISVIDSYLLTVAGYINAPGIKSLKFSDSGTGGHIGYYQSSVSLFFGGSSNSIFYVWGNEIYDIYPAVKAYASDIHLKKNIVESTKSAITLINKFKFYSFDWNEKNKTPGKHTDIGLIAQQVQDLDDNLVYENGDYLHLDGLKLINLSLKAIQELELKNKELVSKIDLLEERISKIEWGLKH